MVRVYCTVMKDQETSKRPYCAVVLHNIRSMQNVGSIFRTADAAGVQEIVLTGYTPLPIDRFGRERSMIDKTALGAQKMVPWRHEENIVVILNEYKNRKIETVAVEQSEHSVDYRTPVAPHPRAFIFGNEVEGIPDGIVLKCDLSVEIPLYGKKESLNVAVSAGIVLFHAVPGV